VKRVAAIDIGTNTVLMLVADVSPDGGLTVVRDEHAIARLGQGVDRHRRLHPEAIARTTEILREHASLARSLGCQRIDAVGTSALRDAQDRAEVLERWQRELALRVRVIDSDEEAGLTYRGCLSGVAGAGGGTHAVLDIGGGSTEVTLGSADRVIDRFSVDLGAVRLTERYWDRYPPDGEKIRQAKREIEAALRAARGSMPSAAWHAVAGTPTTLAAMALKLDQFEVSRVEGSQLTRTFVASAFDEIRELALDDLRHHPRIHPQRADIMGAGTLILLTVMETYDIATVRVSVRGLRYGVALAGAKNQLPPE
jgi:exopolyphosphatase/guanosine-5'-triphosphate,3'-diphosphate pyrophosphatase